MGLKFGLKQYVPIAISALAFVSSAFGATAYINQVGYRPGDAKQFVLSDGSGDVEIVDVYGHEALKVSPSPASPWAPSGQNVQLVDFSELKEPGTYSIKVGGQVVRSDLKVTPKTYEDVTKAALKWFYYQRASMALEQTYAGQWARAAGHTNATVQFHSSAGKSGTTNSSKGWYDAGDYGRYIVNSGITTYTLLSLYEHFPKYFKSLKWNIPAEGTLPDLLAEIKYNLDWMLTMQDTDGGVFHKLTSLGFPGDVMPAADKAALYVIGKGTAATFDFAGVMAVAYRVYKDFDEAYANKCLEAAKKAYAWGSQNPNKAFSNPGGEEVESPYGKVSTGEYGDRSLGDEMLFAGTELFVSTGDASYKQSVTEGNVPNWGDVSGLAVYGVVTHAEEFGNSATAAKDHLIKLADGFVIRASSGYGVTMNNADFVWGSNAVIANQAIWLLHAYYLTGEEDYYNTAKKDLDYLLGKNPLNMSFMTGFGTKSPMLPHHRPSTADGVRDPVPGMLVGGPQRNNNSDIGSQTWECSDYRTSYPATSYTDNRCSYATNEVAINWNAPLAYLAGAIEAINAGYMPNFAKAESKPAEDPSGEDSDAIAPSFANKNGSVDNQVRLRFVDQKVFIEKNGKRYDLKGMLLK